MMIKPLMAVSALALLAACGGSSTSENNYSDTLGAPAAAFAEGVEVKSSEQGMAQVNIDWSKNSGERTTALEEPSFVSIQKGTGENLLLMKINGKSHQFTEEHSFSPIFLITTI